MCCLHSWFYFHSWGASYWWWRNFCKAGLSLPLTISSFLFKQEGPFKISKNDTHLLWWLVPHLPTWLPLLIPCTTICLRRCSSQAGRKGAGCPGTGHIIMNNKEKLRKRVKERTRNLKRVRCQVKYIEIEKMRVKRPPSRAAVVVQQDVNLDAILCSNEI